MLFRSAKRTALTEEEALALEKAFYRSDFVRTSMTIEDRTAFELLLQNTLGRPSSALGDGETDWSDLLDQE